LDERLGLQTLITERLSDCRQGMNTQFRLADLLQQSVYRGLAGDEDLNDAERLVTDPTFRLIGSPKRWDRGAAVREMPRSRGARVSAVWMQTELTVSEAERPCDEKILPYVEGFGV